MTAACAVRAAKAITQLHSMLGVMARLAVEEAVVKRMTKLTTELLRYLENNADSIPDYRRRYTMQASGSRPRS